MFNGAGNYDVGRILAKWGKPWDIEMPGIAIKQYPCCASTHPAIDVMVDLVTAHDLLPEMVDHVDCWTHPRRLNYTNRPDRAARRCEIPGPIRVARGSALWRGAVGLNGRRMTSRKFAN